MNLFQYFKKSNFSCMDKTKLVDKIDPKNTLQSPDGSDEKISFEKKTLTLSERRKIKQQNKNVQQTETSLAPELNQMHAIQYKAITSLQPIGCDTYTY